MLKHFSLLPKFKLHSLSMILFVAFMLMLALCHIVYWHQMDIIKNDLDAVSHAKANLLGEHIEHLKREALFLSNLADAKAIADLSQTPLIETELQVRLQYHMDALTDVFTHYMHSIPNLNQLRYIDNQNGFEKIRLERQKGQLLNVPPSSLQQKNTRDYFIQTTKLNDGEVYVSPINLNHENGALSFPYLPVIRVSTLVRGHTNQHPQGQIVINVLAESLFSRLAIDSVYFDANILMYLVNDEGDYLFHPDNSKTFGFNHGQRYTFEDEFQSVDEGMYTTQGDTSLLSGLTVSLVSKANIYLDNQQRRKVVVIAMATNDEAKKQTALVVFWYWVVIGILILIFKNIRKDIELNAKQLHLDTVVTMEQELNAILSHAPSGIMVVNRQGMITLANTQIGRVFGYSQTELLGQTMAVLLPARFCHMHPEFMQMFFAAPEAKLMGGGREVYGLHKTGIEIPLEIGLSVIEYKGELQAICSVVDISLRKQFEHLFERVVDTLPNAVLLVDFDGVIELVNQETETLFGYSRGELLGLNIDKLVPESFREDHLPWRQSFLSATQDTVENGRHDINGLCKDGSEFPLSIGLCTLETHKGKKRLLSIIDLTERERKTQAITKLKDNLDRTSKMAGIGGWELDLITQTLFYSEETYHIYGLPLGSSLTVEQTIDFYTPESQPIIRQTLAEAIETGKTWDVEVRFVNAKGKMIWVRVMGTVEYNNGIAVKLAGTMQDISERKYYHEELSRSNAELHNFAYVASHDLKSPLRGIDQLASWLEEDLQGKLDDEDAEHLRLMRGRINRMEKLLDDLLAYSRAGKKGDVIHTVDIKDVVENVFDLCNTQNSFSLVFNSTVESITTASVPLEQVLRNLINNAIKHHDSGQGTVWVSVVANERFYTVSVSDDGPGIPEQYSEKVFTMFTTLKPRDEVEGSGMGLAIVKKIVLAMGGDIQLESVQGKGANFNFTWPVDM
ncbi:PAS domain-containing sensor histidine kinase [Shewanella sp. MF05960]|uniref:PAS domain-containing sensor histidine kinase n=1 Tax=Shewanella sp. MF05960 TaxID=3434874 RepID=UPI003D7B1A27